MQTLTAKQKNKDGNKRFRAALTQQALAAGGSEKEMAWAFPGGGHAMVPTLQIPTHLGKELQVGLYQGTWDGAIKRIPNLLRFPNAGDPLSPDVEINVPLGLSRRVSGLFVADASGDKVFLCHRGKINRQGGGFTKQAALEHFSEQLISVDDAGQTADVIRVCSLSSPSMINELAEFVNEVATLKRKQAP